MWGIIIDLNINSLLNSGPLYGKECFLFYVSLSTEAMYLFLVPFGAVGDYAW